MCAADRFGGSVQLEVSDLAFANITSKHLKTLNLTADRFHGYARNCMNNSM